MKRLRSHFSIVFFLMCGLLAAQNGEIRVTRAFLRVGDTSATGSGQVLTQKGEACSRIFVECPFPGATFSGAPIIKWEEGVGEYSLWLEPGYYIFKMYFPGCVPQIINMKDLVGAKLQGSQTYQLDLDLPALGYVPPHSGPQETVLNQDFVKFILTPKTDAPFFLTLDGKTPVLFTDGIFRKVLDYGYHTWTAGCPGYETQSGTFDLHGEKTVDVKVVDLRGTISVKCPTPGATLTFQGEKQGSASSWSKRLPEDTYKIVIEAPSHRPLKKTINLPAKGSEVITDELTPITGFLTVTVTPEEADIEIDGKFVRKGSGILRGVLTGTHTFKVKANGYSPYEETFTLTEGQNLDLTATLKKITGPVAPNGGQGKTFTIPGTQVSFNMMPVTGGSFQMGDNQWDRSKPIHTVTLDSFMIGETEVTQELWQAVMGSNPSKNKGDKYPVEQVSWEDCQKFVSKLNEKLASQLAGQKFSLPTEAQWEFAARGGNSQQKYKYSGSDNIDEVAWYYSNSGSHTHPVKEVGKKPNQLGMYDMSGNVWEWCEDWYDSGFYSKSAATQKNPLNSTKGQSRVIRGGSAWNDPGLCRPGFRFDHNPGNWFYFLGLRLALSVQ